MLISSIALTFFCCRPANKGIDVDLAGHRFVLFDEKRNVIGALESEGLTSYYEDSHVCSDKGVDLYYTSYLSNGLKYSLKLYFSSKKFQGLDILVECELSDSTGFRKRMRNGEIAMLMRKVALHDDIAADESLNNALPGNQYNIYISSDELRDCNKY